MNTVELLAPAGGPEQFKAAVNAGADAVYLGGSIFNARIGAGNFTLDEIKESLDYGHLRHVKTYVTMNTLLDDSDIPKAVKFASKLYEMGVDALIIQDYGLGYAIREALPDFELHLSTQATVYSPRGVLAARELGYKRTVLSRECTLDEIRACAEVGEVEVFIHGALCICYSGQCQLSRYIGGRSGNKGMCAQPCRLPYTYRDTAGRTAPGTNPLSPKDLCLLDDIPGLIEAGAASFKIEGRMKSPEYVATVVSIYRKYIDQYYETGSINVSEADRAALLQVFNRDGFTRGCLEGDPGESLMTRGVSKNSGVLVGKISKNSGKSLTAEIRAFEAIKMHDVLEIRSNTGSTSFKVTYLKEDPKRKGLLTVGDLKDKVFSGDKVYRLISQDLLDKASEIIGTPKKVPVDILLLAKVGQPIKLTAKDPETGLSFTVSDPEILAQPAMKAALRRGDILKQLRKTGDTPFYLNDADILMDENIFAPVSALNALRRELLKGLEEMIISYYERSLEGFAPGSIPEGSGYETHETVFEVDDKAVILPQVTKGSYDRWLEENYEALAAKAKSQRSAVVINNIAWIEPFARLGVQVIGGPGLNIVNAYAPEALKALGMSEEFILSPELLPPEKMEGIPLMISEHRFPPGTLTDRKGAKYSIEYNEETGKTYIFALKYTSDYAWKTILHTIMDLTMEGINA